MNLFSDPLLPFIVAILIMGGIGILEVIGLGVSAFDIDIDVDDADLLGWLGIGHVPILAVIVSFLSLFGLSGMVIQSVTEHPFPVWFAVVAALFISLPVTGVLSRVLGRIMPREETTIISNNHLLGKRATIIDGVGSVGNPTKAKIKDHHGQVHYTGQDE